MRAFWLSFVFCILGGFFVSAQAQQSVWVQIEAHPNEAEALERLTAYSASISPIEGYRLRSGWYAIAIGPLTAAEAPSVLRQLRITRQIPGDSFIADGSRFATQFWPGAGAAPATAATPPAESAEPLNVLTIEAADETPAEARRSESLLTREERMELQVALAWEGFYDSAIDGAIGRGSRNAMAAWQADKGFEATGILTTGQRAELVRAYRDVLSSLGMQAYSDPVAGIGIELPMSMIEFEKYEPPFVHFRAIGENGPRVLLISQSGDSSTLAGLYEVMQTLEIVPLDGPRSLNRNSFILEGIDSRIHSTTYAEVTGDDVKGFALIWPTGDNRRRQLVFDQMRSSFQPVPGTVMPDDHGTGADQSIDLLSGLAIRRPEVSRSGFFVSENGWVLTNLEANRTCGRMTLADDTELSLAARNDGLGLALLSPANGPLRPISVAAIATLPPRLGEEIAVSGFSYGDRLDAASLTFGKLEEMTGLNQEPELRRLSVAATDGDTGGPVFDRSGGVLGMLLARDNGSRLLPQDVRFAAGAEALTSFLNEHGLAARPQTQSAAYAPEDLAALAADMTVLVQCWN